MTRFFKEPQRTFSFVVPQRATKVRCFCSLVLCWFFCSQMFSLVLLSCVRCKVPQRCRAPKASQSESKLGSARPIGASGSLGSLGFHQSWLTINDNSSSNDRRTTWSVIGRSPGLGNIIGEDKCLLSAISNAPCLVMSFLILGVLGIFGCVSQYLSLTRNGKHFRVEHMAVYKTSYN